MLSPVWIATVGGALLCLTYSWFLGAKARSRGIRFGRMSTAVGVAGALVLAGMAVVGPPRTLQPEGVISVYTAEGYPIFPQSRARFTELLSIAMRTTQEVGRRPSKDHVAYEDPATGKMKWVTSSEYKQLVKARRNKQGKGD